MYDFMFFWFARDERFEGFEGFEGIEDWLYVCVHVHTHAVCVYVHTHGEGFEDLLYVCACTHTYRVCVCTHTWSEVFRNVRKDMERLKYSPTEDEEERGRRWGGWGPRLLFRRFHSMSCFEKLWNPNIHRYTRIYTHIHTHTHKYTYIHTHIYIYIYV